MTKDRMMDFVPYMIMGLSMSMLFLTLADVVTR
jgi:hypothetical protein